MKVSDLSHYGAYNKLILMEKALKDSNNEEATLKFAGYEFKIYKFCGASVESNCSELMNEDIRILTSLDAAKLDELDKELDYLKVLIANRKKELLEPKTTIHLSVYSNKVDRKSHKVITVQEHISLLDIYGDNKLIKSSILESHKIHDIKKNKEQIEDTIKAMQAKYNIEPNNCYIPL